MEEARRSLGAGGAQSPATTSSQAQRRTPSLLRQLPMPARGRPLCPCPAAGGLGPATRAPAPRSAATGGPTRPSARRVTIGFAAAAAAVEHRAGVCRPHHLSHPSSIATSSPLRGARRLPRSWPTASEPTRDHPLARLQEKTRAEERKEEGEAAAKQRAALPSRLRFSAPLSRRKI